jgi:hypothetical protein
MLAFDVSDVLDPASLFVYTHIQINTFQFSMLWYWGEWNGYADI